MSDSIDANAVQNAYYVLSLFGAAGAAVAAYARSLHNKIDKTTADLALFKEKVAGEYVLTARFDSMTKQILDSIRDLGTSLGTRIDSILNRPH